MSEKMSNELRQAFTVGRETAISRKDSKLRTEHILYGIMISNNVIHEILKSKIKDFDLLIQDIENFNKRISDNNITITSDDVLNFDTDLQEVIRLCIKNKKKDEFITPELFFTVSFDINLSIIKIIKEHGVSKTFIQRKLKELNISAMYFSEEENNKKTNQNDSQNNRNKSRTPILDNFSRDLTSLANEGKLDPVIGREGEVERVAQILSRRKKNNPILIGEPGVGKTAIAEGLAIKIVMNECPRPLQNKRLVTLDLTSLVAGTKYRGQFEERIKALLEEVRENPNIILFVDEIHTLVGAGNSSGTLDAANVFKPALARGEIQCIGATTLDEYREHIEKDGALDRRFQKVMVNPPNIDQTKDILLNIRDKYQDFHKVEYTDEAINEIVRLADRYITNREFPDKAIDIMDEAGSRTQVSIKPPKKIKDLEDEIKEIKKRKQEVVKSQRFELAADLRDLEKKTTLELEKETKIWDELINTRRMVVTDQMICEVVSIMTGIPITKISQNEVQKLLSIDKEIGNSVIGQNDAIQKISSAIKRNRTGIRKKNKPIGSFLFIGPTGVGKTELAKVLAEKVFGTEDALIRVDMSEYGEKFNVSKLIGAPPGYVGYNEGGQLTEKVKNKPYSLILFDEIEKAHPDIFNVLLQLLDEGHLTDASGRKVNFKNTIVIMTSNIGMKDVQDFGTKIGFSTDGDDAKSAKEIVEKSLKKFFKPEFLNRLDELVFFNYLNKEDVIKIVDIQLNDLRDRLSESNYDFKITKQAKEKIAELGYDKNYGARELNRVIQKYIEDPMSEELLKNGMPDKGFFNITYEPKNDVLKVNLK
jgi:ATP-dependent Clp protease ATP-binding subunit ClpC